MTLSTLLYIIHFIGLGLGVGAATAKLVLVLKCRSDKTFIPAFFKVAPTLTRLIILGLFLLTASGIVWVIRGYELAPQLIAKLVLVGFIWVLGPIIDNAVEPRFRRLAPIDGGAGSAEFARAQRIFLALEIFATLLFYVVIVTWMLR